MRENKVISLSDAVSRVQTGDTLALGGMTLYRRPVAFTRILANLPEPPTDLTLLGFTASYESDLLIGAGLVSAIRACYTGLEIFGLAPHFTEAAQQGRLKVIEESEASLAFGIRAQLAGVSFMPAQGWLGTDLLKLRPDVKVIDDPYRPGEQIVAFPAVEWHIAVIHALRATPSGNAVINGNMGIDSELALGAKREVIITTEEIVEDLNERIHITGAVVTGVVHAPHGAWPTSCYPDYLLDGNEILRYIEACNNGSFDEYLKALSSDG